MVFVIFRKMFCYESEKCSANVCFHVIAERGVEPNNISLSVSSSCSGLPMLVEG